MKPTYWYWLARVAWQAYKMRARPLFILLPLLLAVNTTAWYCCGIIGAVLLGPYGLVLLERQLLDSALVTERARKGETNRQPEQPIVLCYTTRLHCTKQSDTAKYLNERKARVAQRPGGRGWQAGRVAN